ncbi:MAG: methyltransferase family protein [Candidatus Hodarchaeales archaeon]
MDILRVTLFSGLLLHKFIWEVLKRKRDITPGFQGASRKFSIKVIKLGKVLVLLFLLFQTLFLEILPISSQTFFLRTMGSVIFLLGLGTAVLARLQLGDNWVDIEDRQVLPGQALVTVGIYRYIRHPIYAGDFLLLLGLELALNSWLVLAVLLLIPIITRQAIDEEVILSRVLPGYNDYCRRTKRFIPFLV